MRTQIPVIVLWLGLALPVAAPAQSPALEFVGRQLEETGQQIEMALEAGQLSEDEAWAEWYAARDEIIDGAVARGEIDVAAAGDLRRAVGRSELKAQLELAGNRIKAAHENGEMTADEAWAAWHETQQQLVGAAVEAGTITADEAPAWDGSASERSGLDRRLEEAGNAIKQAALRGEITGEEAWEEWYESKDALIAEAIENGELTPPQAEAYHRELHKAELSERLNTAGAQIRAQYAAGDLTEDEAWSTWQVRKEELIDTALEVGEIDAGTADEFRREIEKIEYGQQLKTAVVRGELTEQEAKDAWEAYIAGRPGQPAPPASAPDVERDDNGAPVERVEERPRAADDGERPDDEWARYTREFIARFRLDDSQERQAWRQYRAARERADLLLQRLGPSVEGADGRRVEDVQARIEHSNDRLFERLKAQLDRLPTRAQRRAAGD